MTADIMDVLIVGAGPCASLMARELARLNTAQLHGLLATLRDQSPAFFRQLRADVRARYLSDVPGSGINPMASKSRCGSLSVPTIRRTGAGAIRMRVGVR